MNHLQPLHYFRAGLGNQPDFRKLWLGQTVSAVGSTVTREALPLTAALVLGATPLQMGLLAASASLPVLVVGLVAGAWVDRWRRRPLMIGADIGRAILLFSVPIAAWFHVLRITHLFLVLPLVGILAVVFDTAYQAYLPTLVHRRDLVEANVKLRLSGSLAEVTAPGLAGVLVQTLGGPACVLLDALSFLWSAVTVRGIGRPEQPPLVGADRHNLVGEIATGLRVVCSQPVLRAFAASSLTSSFFGNFFAALYALYALRVLGIGPLLLGIAVACGGVGELVGAVAMRQITQRFGLGPTIIGSCVVGGCVSLIIPLAGGPPLVAASVLMFSQLIADAAGAIYSIGAVSLRQALIPDRLLGRVSASLNVLEGGVGPLGAVVGGILGMRLGIRQTLAIAVIGSLLSILWLCISPIRRLHQIPEQVPEPPCP